MVELLKKLASEDCGQDLAEYGIALAVISIGAGAAAVAVAGSVTALWTLSQAVIAAAV